MTASVTIKNSSRSLSAVEVVSERQHHFFRKELFMIKTKIELIVCLTSVLLFQNMMTI